MITLKKLKNAEPTREANEKWYLYTDNETYEWDVYTLYNKPIDILKLKIDGFTKFEKKVNQISAERNRLFKDAKNNVVQCPVCGIYIDHYSIELTVYGANYVSCTNCSHRFVANRLNKSQLEEYYQKSSTYQSTYTQKEKAFLRIEEIHKPKLHWLLNNYQRIYDRHPKAFLDIGAGSGHFAACCRNMGIHCDGIELSESGVNFAKDVFNIDLINIEFLENWEKFVGKYDVVTFWGLIEHVPDPLLMLQNARSVINDEETPMIVGSVPRWHSISSAIQFLKPDSIIRHLDPLGHIQCFTDTSICTLIARSNLKLNGVWYFGMDAYEMLIQLSLQAKTDDVILTKMISQLQIVLDQSQLSDSVVFACSPEI